MQTKQKSVLAAALVAAAMSAPLWAKPATSAKPAKAAKLATTQGVSNADRKWMMASADGQMKEISLGNLVSKRASNPKMKQFARHMVQDHTKALGELQKLAKSKGVALPAELGKKNRDTYDHMAKLSPSRLSHDYIENMVEDHYKDVKDFSHEAKHGQDKGVRAWAKKTTPTLQMHLQMAREAARGVVSKRKS